MVGHKVKWLFVGILLPVQMCVFAQIDAGLPNQQFSGKKSYVHNILKVAIDANDTIYVNSRATCLDSLSSLVTKHILNYGKDASFSDSPQHAIVLLSCKRQTTYKRYVDVYTAIRSTYDEIRNEKSIEWYKKEFDDLEEHQQKHIRKEIPVRISEAEPTAE